MNFRLFGFLAALSIAVIFTGCKEDCTFECKNGSECVDGTCDCLEGWTGTDCSTAITMDCANECMNGGVCSNGTCNCEDGWTGDDCNTPNATPMETISGDALRVSGEVTLSADKIWEVRGRLTVEEGGCLTIEPGTIIKFAEGQEDAASSLLVTRGGKIMADGTADAPIIMTSVLDDIELGQITGTNLTKEKNQLWGGLIVLGKAKVSAKDGDIEANIEGIPVGPDSKYGGNDDSDNSGVIQYVSVRHGGTDIGEGNEINGITLGGVGSSTKIGYIEVVANFDDGIEFFGGSVNVKHAIVAYQGDDAIDIDQNYSGTVDNFMIKHGIDKTDEALELDGPEGSTYTDGKFTLVNGTIINDGTDGSAGDLKSKSQGTIENVSFEGYGTSDFLKIRASYDNDPMLNCPEKTDAYSNYIADEPCLIVKNCGFDGLESLTHAVNAYLDGDDAPCELKTDGGLVDMTTSANGNSTSAVTGADKSAFIGWSWVDANGEL